MVYSASDLVFFLVVYEMITAGILAFVCRWVIGVNVSDPEDDEVDGFGYMGNGLDAYNHWVDHD